MKKVRILILVALMMMPVAGYLYATNGTPQPGSIEELIGTIFGTGGCGFTVDPANTPHILKYETGSGHRTHHGVLGLFRTGLMSGKIGSDFCALFGSSTPSCQTVNAVGEAGIDINIKSNVFEKKATVPESGTGIYDMDDITQPQKGPLPGQLP